MRTRWPVVFLLALASLAATPAARASAVLVVAEDGGFPAASVRTVRSLTATELRAGGVELLDEPRFRELFRLHKTRLMFGVSAIIPFETLRGVDEVSWGLQLRAGF